MQNMPKIKLPKNFSDYFLDPIEEMTHAIDLCKMTMLQIVHNV